VDSLTSIAWARERGMVKSTVINRPSADAKLQAHVRVDLCACVRYSVVLSILRCAFYGACMRYSVVLSILRCAFYGACVCVCVRACVRAARHGRWRCLRMPRVIFVVHCRCVALPSHCPLYRFAMLRKCWLGTMMRQTATISNSSNNNTNTNNNNTNTNTTTTATTNNNYNNIVFLFLLV
jgi:hypothetical protein